MHGLEDIEKSTGLNINFIRKCIKKVAVLTPYVKRGMNNAIMFDNEALVIFDQIKQLKATNLSIALIDETLSKSVNGNIATTKIPNIRPTKTINQTSFDPHAFLEKLEEKNQRILELEQQLHGIKLLTGGKTEEQLQTEKIEREQARLQVAEKLSEIEGLEGRLFILNKRKTLLKELKELNRKL